MIAILPNWISRKDSTRECASSNDPPRIIQVKSSFLKRRFLRNPGQDLGIYESVSEDTWLLLNRGRVWHWNKRNDRREHKEQPRKENDDTRSMWSTQNGKKVLRFNERIQWDVTSRNERSDLFAIFRKGRKGRGKTQGWRIKRAVTPCRVCFLSLKNTHTFSVTSNVVSFNFYIDWSVSVAASMRHAILHVCVHMHVRVFVWKREEVRGHSVRERACTCVLARVYKRIYIHRIGCRSGRTSWLISVM